MTKKKNSLQGPGSCQPPVSTLLVLMKEEINSFDFFKKNSNN